MPVPEVLTFGWSAAEIGQFLLFAGFNLGLAVPFFFGGTSLLILVGVAMDTVAQIEAQLVMRNYEGFLGAGSRLRGRRS